MKYKVKAQTSFNPADMITVEVNAASAKDAWATAEKLIRQTYKNCLVVSVKQ
jgi:hypothetical protein